MAVTTVHTDGRVIDFRNDFFLEYMRRNRFFGYTGAGVDNPIVIKRGRGPTIRHPLLTQLDGAGVSGSSTLRGNGENIGNYFWDTSPTYYRHAVEFDKENLEKSNIAFMRAGRPLLLDWAMNQTRNRQIQAMAAVYNGTTYADFGGTGFTEAIADTWQVNNADRVIYGDNIALTGDSSAELGGIDGAADTLVRARVKDMRRIAEDADPAIRPISTDQESEVYVLFVGSESFNDLKNDLETINSNADVRGMGNITRGNNIIARDGDLFHDGVVVRKVPEITKLFAATGKPLATAGSSVAVEPAFFCGAQALLWGLGQNPDIIFDGDFDFKFQPGVAVELKEDIKKAFFNDIQHGMVSGFFSGG